MTERNDLLDDITVGKTKTAPVENFRMGKQGVTAILMKEAGALLGDVEFRKEAYKEIVSLKLARGKKDPNNSGTVGYIINNDGSMEEVPNATKLSELPWGELKEAAFVIGYLSQQRTSFRVYSGKTMADIFGMTNVTPEDDSLD